MSHNLGANFTRPEQQIRQRIANLVLWKLSNRGDFLLRMRTTADGLADAIGRREFSEHPRDPPRRKSGLGINRHPRTIGNHATPVLRLFTSRAPLQLDLADFG